MKKSMITLIALFTLSISYAQSASKDKEIKVFDYQEKSAIVSEKIAKGLNLKIKTFESLFIEMEGKKYKCFGAGGEIRCVLLQE